METKQLEKMITSAIDMESQIYGVYADAVNACEDDAGKRILIMLRDDEHYHMTFLKELLDDLRKTGRMNVAALKTTIPTAGQIADQVEGYKKTMAVEDHGMIQQLLSKALKFERQTSDYYRKLVGETDGEVRRLFQQFLDIEDAHVEAVQYELDYVIKTGYWFEFKEFDME